MLKTEKETLETQLQFAKMQESNFTSQVRNKRNFSLYNSKLNFSCHKVTDTLSRLKVSSCIQLWKDFASINLDLNPELSMHNYIIIIILWNWGEWWQNIKFYQAAAQQSKYSATILWDWKE